MTSSGIALPLEMPSTGNYQCWLSSISAHVNGLFTYQVHFPATASPHGGDATVQIPSTVGNPNRLQMWNNAVAANRTPLVFTPTTAYDRRCRVYLYEIIREDAVGQRWCRRMDVLYLGVHYDGEIWMPKRKWVGEFNGAVSHRFRHLTMPDSGRSALRWTIRFRWPVLTVGETVMADVKNGVGWQHGSSMAVSVTVRAEILSVQMPALGENGMTVMVKVDLKELGCGVMRLQGSVVQMGVDAALGVFHDT